MRASHYLICRCEGNIFHICRQDKQTMKKRTRSRSCALALSNYRPMASPRRWQTSCQSFGCYDMRWERPRLEGQNCVSDLHGTIAVTTEAHVRIRGSLSWWVSGETPVTHHMSHTPNTPAFICTDGGKIPEKCVKLVSCMWEVGLLCFALS